VMASVITLQALHGLSDNETVDAVTFDLRWKAACGLPITAGSFHSTTLTYWRRRLAASDRPNRIFEAVKAVVAATGALSGRTRRALDSTILDDAVATQDTVTQLIGAIRRVRREVPGAGEVIAAYCRAHDYDDPGKPAIAWDDADADDEDDDDDEDGAGEAYDALDDEALDDLDGAGDARDEAAAAPAPAVIDLAESGSLLEATTGELHLGDLGNIDEVPDVAWNVGARADDDGGPATQAMEPVASEPDEDAYLAELRRAIADDEELSPAAEAFFNQAAYEDDRWKGLRRRR